EPRLSQGEEQDHVKRDGGEQQQGGGMAFEAEASRRPGLGHLGHAATPVASPVAASINSASLAERPNSPTMRPSRMTRIRSEAPRISGRSDDTIITAVPARARSRIRW